MGKMENPGALAGATGAGNSEQAFISPQYTLLGGDGGTGKSLLAKLLAAACVTGKPWMGLPAKAGPAVYFTAEDDRDEVHRRLDDILQATSGSYDDLGNLIFCSHAGQDALLATQASPTAPLQPTDLYRRLDMRMAAVKPVVVVLDTLADLSPAMRTTGRRRGSLSASCGRWR
jgi:RecA-family ATPase